MILEWNVEWLFQTYTNFYYLKHLLFIIKTSKIYSQKLEYAKIYHMLSLTIHCQNKVELTKRHYSSSLAEHLYFLVHHCLSALSWGTMNILNTSEFVQVTERSCLVLPVFGYFIWIICLYNVTKMCFLKNGHLALDNYWGLFFPFSAFFSSL